MSEQIKPGDLLIVVRPSRCPKATNHNFGYVFRTDELKINGGGVCHWCNEPHPWAKTHLYAHDSAGFWWACYRLKHVPPLSDLENMKQKEDVREPA